LFTFVRSLFRPRAALLLENLALRQQLAVLRRRLPRPKPTRLDKAFWIALSRVWSGWRGALATVRPATVVRWHRAGFRALWRWRSRPRGRPPIHAGLRPLVHRLAAENPTWGAPRIHGEIIKLGHDVSESTVARLMPRPRKPPSPTWRTFLSTHLSVAAAMDMFVVPTAGFQNLYCFVVLHHGRRKIVHTNVTAHPTAAWILQQLREAFPDDMAPRFLHRDRDAAFEALDHAFQNFGIEQVVSAPRSPWQNPTSSG
jgi:putative transposase